MWGLRNDQGKLEMESAIYWVAQGHENVPVEGDITINVMLLHPQAGEIWETV